MSPSSPPPPLLHPPLGVFIFAFFLSFLLLLSPVWVHLNQYKHKCLVWIRNRLLSADVAFLYICNISPAEVKQSLCVSVVKLIVSLVLMCVAVFQELCFPEALREV